MENMIEIKIPPRREFIPTLRFAAGIFANSLGFDIEKIEDIKLVVGEACNNSVLYGDAADNEITVKFYSREEAMFIEVTDKGYGFEIDAYRDPVLERPEEGGFGIYIIKSLSDMVEIKSSLHQGTSLCIKFNLE